MTNLYGLLIDLNDGLHDDASTRAQDAAHELQTHGYNAYTLSDGIEVAWRVAWPWYSIASGPERVVVYDGMEHHLYTADQTDEAICHFCRLVEG